MDHGRVPAEADIGDWIAHDLMPDFFMKVHGIQPCITDAERPEGHDSFLVHDPDGKPDWLCAYDVRRFGGQE